MRIIFVLAILVVACSAKKTWMDFYRSVLTLKNIRNPPFIDNLDSAKRTKFTHMMINMDLPRKEVEEKLDQMAAEYNFSEEWKKYKAEFEAKKANLIKAVRETLKKLPDLFDKAVALEADKNLSFMQMKDKFLEEGEADENLLTAVMEMAGAVGEFRN